MTRVTIHYGNAEPQECNRMQLHPQDLRKGDVYVCEYSGFHTVVRTEQRGNIVDVYVQNGNAFVHNKNELVELARPIPKGE